MSPSCSRRRYPTPEDEHKEGSDVRTIDFKKTIGISEKQPSEAFDAFVSVIDTSSLPLCTLLEDMGSKELLPEFARFLDTTTPPL